MCGITGIYNLNRGHGVDKSVLTQMATALAHRGPDDAAVLVDGDLGLGFRRLSIIDLAHGQQPFFSADGSVVLICNGEIYNYQELRREMTAKGYTFRSNCDVEVIVYLYQAYGIGFINRLNGQFAFCLFDKKTGTVLLARDHFGICPLFYTLAGSSSRISAPISEESRPPLR